MNTPDPSAVSPADPLAANTASDGAKSHAPQPAGLWRNIVLTFGALGVVFGDIGTSPLYALRATVTATSGTFAGHDAVLGAVSLIFWALMIIVTLKYVVVIMRADNDGEGGILALATLAHRSPGISRRTKSLIGFAAIMGLALFYGDGMLTPAVTVLSAVEGIAIENRALEVLVLPVSLIILVGLFALQSRGTAKLGTLFGALMVIWFAVLAGLGLTSMLATPEILSAVDPRWIVKLFIHEPWAAFVALGAVVLAVTGCEALYADMGHFGKRPIQYAWFLVVLPALLLNYFGQGAALLRNPGDVEFAFYAVGPDWLHMPLVALATLVGIIASQAVISAVFSVTRQAVQLGQLPRMEIRHTSATEYGQIYMPRMNTILCVGVVLLVLIFKTSDSLLAAYGIAVTGMMVIDTFHVSIVAIRQWLWQARWAVLLLGTFLLIDITLLASNALKILAGGSLPLFIAAAVFVMMETWRIGRRAHMDVVRNDSLPMHLFLERADKTPTRVAGTAVFLARSDSVVPGALLHNLKHNKVLHERVLLVNVSVEDTPMVSPDKRLEIEKLGKGFYSIRIHYGFFETPDVPQALNDARRFGLAIDVDHSTFFIGRETLVAAKQQSSLGRWRTWLYMQMASNALSPARYYQLPPNRVVELGTQVTI